MLASLFFIVQVELDMLDRLRQVKVKEAASAKQIDLIQDGPYEGIG